MDQKLSSVPLDLRLRRGKGVCAFAMPAICVMIKSQRTKTLDAQKNLGGQSIVRASRPEAAQVCASAMPASRAATEKRAEQLVGCGVKMQGYRSQRALEVNRSHLWSAELVTSTEQNLNTEAERAATYHGVASPRVNGQTDRHELRAMWR
jgi:hypothetical protein